MGDCFNRNLQAFRQFNKIGQDSSWRSATISDLQPRLDWFVHPTHLMDDPLETITIDHAMKRFNETKKEQMVWQDTNCIDGMKVPSVNPFTDHRFGIRK